MPSKSKAQQRFFGMVDTYKKGEMKNASSKIKKAAEGMSMSDVKDFAETKHKGLPEKVEEQTIIRLTESDLHSIVKESVYKILKENYYISDRSLNAMEDAFSSKKGIDILNKGVKVIRGNVYPDAYYTEGHYTNRNTDSLADAIIEYPDGKRHVLIRKQRVVRETVDGILNNEAQDHTYSEKEMKWLYDNQGELTPLERKVLNAGMWVRARKANYHGYVKEWPNIAVINGEIFYYENGKLEKIPSWK